MPERLPSFFLHRDVHGASALLLLRLLSHSFFRVRDVP
jgi:hypothetical protein